MQCTLSLFNVFILCFCNYFSFYDQNAPKQGFSKKRHHCCHELNHFVKFKHRKRALWDLCLYLFSEFGFGGFCYLVWFWWVITVWNNVFPLLCPCLVNKTNIETTFQPPNRRFLKTDVISLKYDLCYLQPLAEFFICSYSICIHDWWNKIYMNPVAAIFDRDLTSSTSPSGDLPWLGTLSWTREGPRNCPARIITIPFKLNQ